MSPRTRRPRILSGLAAGALALGAAGCAMDEVQFNGGLFDAVGLSDSARAKSSSSEPKIAERAPLVVPPALDRLPAPGDPAVQDANLAAIRDPDAVKAADQKELERQQAEYCKVHYEQAVQRGDDAEASTATGPLGPCRPSVLNAIKKWNSAEE